MTSSILKTFSTRRRNRETCNSDLTNTDNCSYDWSYEKYIEYVNQVKYAKNCTNKDGNYVTLQSNYFLVKYILTRSSVYSNLQDNKYLKGTFLQGTVYVGTQCVNPVQTKVEATSPVNVSRTVQSEVRQGVRRKDRIQKEFSGVSWYPHSPSIIGFRWELIYPVLSQSTIYKVRSLLVKSPNKVYPGVNPNGCHH